MKNKKIDVLFLKAMYLFSNYIGNDGDLDYPEKQYSWLCDEIEDVQVGYYKDEDVNSDYANNLRKEEYTLTEKEAIILLENRIESIEDCFKTPIIYPQFKEI